MSQIRAVADSEHFVAAFVNKTHQLLPNSSKADPESKFNSFKLQIVFQFSEAVIFIFQQPLVEPCQNSKLCDVGMFLTEFLCTLVCTVNLSSKKQIFCGTFVHLSYWLCILTTLGELWGSTTAYKINGDSQLDKNSPGMTWMSMMWRHIHAN